MEIEETFSSLNEIQTVFEKDKMTWRISIDDEEDEREKKEIKEKLRKENNSKDVYFGFGKRGTGRKRKTHKPLLTKDNQR